jgi:uncharacterized protein (DUF1330 family)
MDGVRLPGLSFAANTLDREEPFMTAYVIFLREGPIHTPAEMEEYRRVGSENPIDPKMGVLAVYGAQVPLEGDPPEGAVILQFPSVEDARAWYYGDYQKAAPHRRAAAEYRGFIVEGYEPPAG